MTNFEIPDGYKVIPGYSRYAINDEGIVIRIVSNGKHNGYAGKIMKIQIVGKWRKKRMRVTLTNDSGIEKYASIHRLVLLTFIGYSDLEVNHLDGNPLNNHIDNLEYCTGAQNREHAIHNKLLPRGSKHHNAKITDIDVMDIRKLYSEGIGPTAISKKYPITRNVVKDIIKRRTWKHVP